VEHSPFPFRPCEEYAFKHCVGWKWNDRSGRHICILEQERKAELLDGLPIVESDVGVEDHEYRGPGAPHDRVDPYRHSSPCLGLHHPDASRRNSSSDFRRLIRTPVCVNDHPRDPNERLTLHEDVSQERFNIAFLVVRRDADGDGDALPGTARLSLDNGGQKIVIPVSNNIPAESLGEAPGALPHRV
jgi:hypothetical protein